MTRTHFLAATLAVPLLLAGSLQAAPVSYVYSTGSVLLEVRGQSAASAGQRLFSADTTLSGGFVYDNAGDLTLPAPPSGLAYAAITGLTGQAGGFSFQDPAGRVVVNNEGQPLGSPPELVDMLTIQAQPPGVTGDLQGFTATDGSGLAFELVNVRLFWLNGDFLGPDNALPAELPPTGAVVTRAALDFRAVGDPGTTHTVFFEPLQVAVVPLPAAVWLMLTALGTLAGLRRLQPGNA